VESLLSLVAVDKKELFESLQKFFNKYLYEAYLLRFMVKITAEVLQE
jgi:hypothetical protein